MKQLKKFKLTDGSEATYQQFTLKRPEGHIGKYDDNILEGLTMSKRVNSVSTDVSTEVGDVLHNLSLNGFFPDSVAVVDGLVKTMEKTKSLGDEFGLNITVGKSAFKVKDERGPSLYFTDSHHIEYTASKRPMESQARQIRSILSPEEFSKRVEKRSVLSCVMGVPWNVIKPEDYVQRVYSSSSMKRIMFGGSELKNGIERKTVVKEIIIKSGVKKILTLQPSEIITASVGQVDTIYLISTLDNPCADVFINHYRPILEKIRPDLSICLICYNGKIDELCDIRVYEFNALLATVSFNVVPNAKFVEKYGDGHGLDLDSLFLFNFYPQMYKFAGQFSFSIGFFSDYEYAKTLPYCYAPPKLLDAEMDRFSVTYSLIEQFPEVLNKDSASYYNPDRNIVIAFSEHLAYPDVVVDTSKLILPSNMVILPLHCLSSKVSPDSNLKVFFSSRDVIEPMMLIQPMFDISHLYTSTANVKFAPSVDLMSTMFIKDTMINDNSVIVYPVTAVYWYTMIMGVKVFLDFDSRSMNYLERRLLMIKANMDVLPLSNYPHWEFSLLIDLKSVTLYYDVGVRKKTIMNPFRNLNRRVTKDYKVPSKITGYSVNMNNVLVLDPKGLCYLSHGEGLTLSGSDSKGKLYTRKISGGVYDFCPLDYDGRFLITKIMHNGYNKAPIDLFLADISKCGFQLDDLNVIEAFLNGV